MRRTGALALLVTCALGLLALLVVAARDERDLAFTIGVVPTTPAAKLAPGATVCQTGITVPDSFTRVSLRAGTPLRPGQPLGVTVRDAYSRRVLAGGRIEGGYSDRTDQTATVGSVAAGERIAVCVRNDGDRRALVYGNASVAALPSQAQQDGRTLPTDLTVVFLKADRSSMLAQLPDVFERAAVFRPGWVGPWVFWLLTLAALVGVPLLLARALADSADAP